MAFDDKLLEYGLEGAIYLSDPDYDDAAVGYSEDGRVIYDYDKLVESMMADGMSSTDAVEWVEYNVIRAIPYCGNKAPIIMYKFEE